MFMTNGKPGPPVPNSSSAALRAVTGDITAGMGHAFSSLQLSNLSPPHSCFSSFRVREGAGGVRFAGTSEICSGAAHLIKRIPRRLRRGKYLGYNAEIDVSPFLSLRDILPPNWAGKQRVACVAVFLPPRRGEVREAG